MDTFIQFIVKNFFIVIVVVGFIISLLNKVRKGNAGSDNRMPNFGGNPPLPKMNPQQRRQPMQTRQQDASRPERSAMNAEPRISPSLASPAVKTDAQYTRPLAAERLPEDAIATAYAEAEGGFAKPRQRAAASAPAERPPFRMPEGDELRRAVVLAEVLGPPRAKRPFRRP